MIKKVLGIKIDDISSAVALEAVSQWLSSREKNRRLIATVGPEFVLTAQDDDDFANILNSADLCLPEGKGLQLFAGVVNRSPGTDFVLKLCHQASLHGWRIGLLGGFGNSAQLAGQKLVEKFPKLEIAFILGGGEADNVISQAYNSKPNNNEKYKCDILFVALGHPKQEKLIHHLIKEDSQKIVFHIGVGVGGAFDQISGNIARPPKWIRDLGLEWLYRPFVEKPGRRLQRVKRVFNALIIFPLRVVASKFKS